MDTLLELSVGGGILIAVIVAVRALTLHRLPKTAFLLLWAAALLRLLLPLRIPSPVSIYQAAGRLDAFQRRGGLLLPDTAAPRAAAASPRFSPAAAIWLSGFALLALAILWLHLRSRRVYRESLPVERPFVKAWLERHRLRRPIQVRCSDQIDAPLTYGVLWPVILLPASLDWTDEKSLGYVLAHELAHIRRFDALHKWLLAAVICIHWFNPLVWVMYVLANRDLELSCDASVVRQYGSQSRASYALALVGMEERRGPIAPLASGFSRNGFRERITAVMKSRPVTVLSAAAALVLVGVVIGVFATSAPAGRPLPDSEAGAPSVSRVERPEPVIPGELPEALRLEQYEDMSIAAFNRSIYAALSDESTMQAYEDALADLGDTDPDAAYFRNTVQASLTEYAARMDEVYSGRTVDPEFYGSIEWQPKGNAFFGYEEGGYWANYSFTYRILDQDTLTVGERDAFLQQLMAAAEQAAKDAGAAGAGQAFTDALTAAGEAASNRKIQFTGCQLYDLETY